MSCSLNLFTIVGCVFNGFKYSFAKLRKIYEKNKKMAGILSLHEHEWQRGAALGA
jgi:hypothetical protein